MNSHLDFIASHNPGTPDTEVVADRLRGRNLFRCYPEDRQRANNEATGIEKNKRTDFWLGWYDERLRRWYGR